MLRPLFVANLTRIRVANLLILFPAKVLSQHFSYRFQSFSNNPKDFAGLLFAIRGGELSSITSRQHPFHEMVHVASLSCFDATDGAYRHTILPRKVRIRTGSATNRQSEAARYLRKCFRMPTLPSTISHIVPRRAKE